MTRGTGQRERPDTRELHWWGGIVSATIEDLAAVIGVDAEAIEEAVESGVTEPLADTAKQNGRKGRDRPTDPQLRPLAFCHEELEALVGITGGTSPRS